MQIHVKLVFICVELLNVPGIASLRSMRKLGRVRGARTQEKKWGTRG